MSTRGVRREEPGLLLLFFLSVAVVAGAIAWTLLGELQTTTLSSSSAGVNYWPVLLGVFMPCAAVVGVLAYCYLTNSGKR